MLQTEPAKAHDEKLLLHNLVKRDPRAGLAEDVRRGLSTKPKRFLPKYFYDQLGSQLFDGLLALLNAQQELSFFLFIVANLLLLVI